METINKVKLEEIYDINNKSNLINKKIVIDFFAEWCQPCKRYIPILENISNKFPDLHIVKINVDGNEDLVRIFNIRNIPTLVVINQDSSLDTINGLQTEENLISKLCL